MARAAPVHGIGQRVFERMALQLAAAGIDAVQAALDPAQQPAHLVVRQLSRRQFRKRVLLFVGIQGRHRAPQWLQQAVDQHQRKPRADQRTRQADGGAHQDAFGRGVVVGHQPEHQCQHRQRCARQYHRHHLGAVGTRENPRQGGVGLHRNHRGRRGACADAMQEGGRPFRPFAPALMAGLQDARMSPIPRRWQSEQLGSPGISGMARPR